MIFGLGFFLLFMLARHGVRDESLLLITLLLTVWTVVVLQSVGLMCWISWHGRPWRNEARARFLRSVQTPEVSGGGLRIIRAADDEASSTMALAQLSGWLGATATRLTRPWVWSTMFGLLGTAGLGFELLAPTSISDLSTGVITILPSAACLLSLALVSIPAVFSLTQGWDGATAALFAVISAEVTPPGEHQVLQRRIRDAHVRGLAHSSLYDDPDVIAWITEQLT
jgi:hypothetical protein